MNCWQNLRTHGTCSVATSVLYNRFGPHQIGVAAVNEIKMTRINYCRTERKKCRNIREHSCITLSLLGLTSQWGPLYCRPWAPTHTYNNHDRHPVTKSFLFCQPHSKISLHCVTYGHFTFYFDSKPSISTIANYNIHLQWNNLSPIQLSEQQCLN